jgi:hypothetical protein
MSKPKRYPEHEKLAARQAEADLIGSFLDYLIEQRFRLCKFHNHTRKCKADGCQIVDWYPHVDDTKPEIIIGGFLGIDPKKIDREKQRMEDAIRKGAQQ